MTDKLSSLFLICFIIFIMIEGYTDVTEFRTTTRILSENTADYKKYARAQSGEDIWLWENIFYGKKNGTIVESGALDGNNFII